MEFKVPLSNPAPSETLNFMANKTKQECLDDLKRVKTIQDFPRKIFDDIRLDRIKELDEIERGYKRQIKNLL